MEHTACKNSNSKLQFCHKNSIMPHLTVKPRWAKTIPVWKNFWNNTWKPITVQDLFSLQPLAWHSETIERLGTSRPRLAAQQYALLLSGLVPFCWGGKKSLIERPRGFPPAFAHILYILFAYISTIASSRVLIVYVLAQQSSSAAHIPLPLALSDRFPSFHLCVCLSIFLCGWFSPVMGLGRLCSSHCCNVHVLQISPLSGEKKKEKKNSAASQRTRSDTALAVSSLRLFSDIRRSFVSRQLQSLNGLMELKSDGCAGLAKGWLAFQLLKPCVLGRHSLDCRSWYSAGWQPLSRIGALEWIAIESDMRRLIRAYLHCMTNAGSAITEPLFWCRSVLCGRSAAAFSVILTCLTCFPHLLGWFLHVRLFKREAFQKKEGKDLDCNWTNLLSDTKQSNEIRLIIFVVPLSQLRTSSFLPACVKGNITLISTYSAQRDAFYTHCKANHFHSS